MNNDELYIVNDWNAEMPTLPLLVGDLRILDLSPALLLWYLNFPLLTSIINIVSRVGNFGL